MWRVKDWRNEPIEVFDKKLEQLRALGYKEKQVKAKGWLNKLLNEPLDRDGKKNRKRNRETAPLTQETATTTVQLINGEPLELKGKITLLAFWFSGCGYCYKSMPKLEELHRTMGIQGLQVLGVNDVDSDEYQIQTVLDKEGVTYPNTTDEIGLLEGYVPQGYPTYILLDRDGKLVDMQDGYSHSNLERMVKRWVKKLNK
jgi:thiol-disulfide isomerase/thioredoxin